MGITQHLTLIAELDVAELANGVEQPVFGGVGGDVDDHQRVIDELVELIRDGEQILVAVADDVERIGGSELTSEHRQAAQQNLQLGFEMLVRPFEGVVQHSMTFVESLRAAQEAEPFVEMMLDLFRRHRSNSRSSKFDRQRDSVEAPTDPRHHGFTLAAEVDAGVCRLCSGDEHLIRWRVVCAGGERVDGVDLLTGDTERGAAGGENTKMRTGLEQFDREVGTARSRCSQLSNTMSVDDDPIDVAMASTGV